MRTKVVVELLMVILPGASPLAAQGDLRWTEVYSDSAQVVSIDTESITSLGDSVYRVWERSVSRASNEVQVLARADFDCRLRLTRAIAVILPGYQPVLASEDDREWSEIMPGSPQEGELRRVCGVSR